MVQHLVIEYHSRVGVFSSNISLEKWFQPNIRDDVQLGGLISVMACGSSCCGPPAVAPPVPSDKEESQPQDDCCERDLRMAENTRKDDCSSQDDCRGDSHVETPAGNALACIDDDCCNATELEEDKQWQMISPQGSGSCQDVPPSKVSEPTEKGDCCTQTRHSEGDEDVRSDKTSAGCEHDCCSDSTPKDQDGLEFGMAENRVPDACCGSESLNDDRCEDSASASAIMQLEHAGDPSCCAGKASPCCDTSCLDRIALRECKKDTVVVEATEQLQGKLLMLLGNHSLLLTDVYQVPPYHRRLMMAMKEHHATSMLEQLGKDTQLP